MARPLLKPESAADSATAYDVYIYHRPANTNEEIQDWERKTTTADVRRALLKARSLHKSERYNRVEVKKRTFDSKTRSVKASTLRVYEHRWPRQTLWRALLFALIGVCSLVSVGVVYFLPA